MKFLTPGLRSATFALYTPDPPLPPGMRPGFSICSPDTLKPIYARRLPASPGALRRKSRSYCPDSVVDPVPDETASWTGRLVGGQGIAAGGRFRPRAAGDLQRVAGRKRRTCAQRPRQEGGWQFASSVEPGLMRDARFGADFAHASSSGSTAGIIAITSRTAMAMLNARAWPGSRSARRTNEPKASHGKLPANPATRNTIANVVA